MIFLVQESLMNGTVTMRTTIHGIEAAGYGDAVSTLRDKLSEWGGVQGVLNFDGVFHYTKEVDGFTLSGFLRLEPLEVINKEE